MNEVAPSPAPAPIGCREQQIRDAPAGPAAGPRLLAAGCWPLVAGGLAPVGTAGGGRGRGSAHLAAPSLRPALRQVPPSPPATFLFRASRGDGAVCVRGGWAVLNPGSPFSGPVTCYCETRLTLKRPARCGVGVSFAFTYIFMVMVRREMNK